MRSHQTGTALYSHHQIYQIVCFVPILCPASWTMEGVLVPLKSQAPTPVPWIPPPEPSQGFPPSLTPFLPSYAIFPFLLYHSHQHTDLFCHLFYLKTLLLLCSWLDQNFSKVTVNPHLIPNHSIQASSCTTTPNLCLKWSARFSRLLSHWSFLSPSLNHFQHSGLLISSLLKHILLQASEHHTLTFRPLPLQFLCWVLLLFDSEVVCSGFTLDPSSPPILCL